MPAGMLLRSWEYLETFSKYIKKKSLDWQMNSFTIIVQNISRNICLLSNISTKWLSYKFRKTPSSVKPSLSKQPYQKLLCSRKFHFILLKNVHNSFFQNMSDRFMKPEITRNNFWVTSLWFCNEFAIEYFQYLLLNISWSQTEDHRWTIWFVKLLVCLTTIHEYLCCLRHEICGLKITFAWQCSGQIYFCFLHKHILHTTNWHMTK